MQFVEDAAYRKESPQTGVPPAVLHSLWWRFRHRIREVVELVIIHKTYACCDFSSCLESDERGIVELYTIVSQQIMYFTTLP